MQTINLWEALIDVLDWSPLTFKRERAEIAVKELGEAAPYGQEIDITAYVDEQGKKGWSIRIHNCFVHGEAEIRIPARLEDPIVVVSDDRLGGSSKEYRRE